MKNGYGEGIHCYMDLNSVKLLGKDAQMWSHLKLNRVACLLPKFF